MAQGRPRELEFVARLCYFGKPLKCYFNTNGFIGKRPEMSKQILPAASLRSTNRLPAARAWVEGSNHLIWMALWSIGRAIFGAASNLLPALRGARPWARARLRRQGGKAEGGGRQGAGGAWLGGG